MGRTQLLPGRLNRLQVGTYDSGAQAVKKEFRKLLSFLGWCPILPITATDECMTTIDSTPKFRITCGLGNPPEVAAVDSLHNLGFFSVDRFAIDELVLRGAPKTHNIELQYLNYTYPFPAH